MLRSRTKSNGKTQHAEKLDMDFAGVIGRQVHMDDNNDELIDLLCAKIGVIMEDASVIALTIGAVSAEERTARIDNLQRASASIAAISAAVASLV
ncbi:hypothetical protein GVM20_11840 [Porphyrobacter sp. SLTP]|uniref:hypothetical protein n=1 Tax=Porphyrobacter sp. SLTP TaxID=2683266 RepID=UPI0014130F03|nr:hypothetical protein [Porphyrobacter sp. SLTP]NBB25821.1 hypothetical protein [Porphyrobacter sp. SLTP]